ncbi:MAG: methionine adenosyltransferase [Bacilli bacterium]|mgnify:FL=1|nr:methionine adenosyltransferase [Bacilli bacterium]
MKKLFTSESVTPGHPDKLCDKIADMILDAYLKEDSSSRVAVEVCAHKNGIVVMGEVTSKAKIDIERIVRNTIIDVGYDNDNLGFNGNNVKVSININTQSNDIAMGVNTSSDSKLLGAGDQGMMFGYATDETENFMPYSIYLANKLSEKLYNAFKTKKIPYLRPDGKTQVTICYIDDVPKYVDTIVISAQHDEIDLDTLRKDIKEKIIDKTIPKEMINENTKIYINPTGRFVLGGPIADSGLTGRKIIVDTYGGVCGHGGGAFSGKDYTKVDRSASYYARYVCKNIVASKICSKMELQVSYAIGMSKPVSLYINTYNTNKIPEDKILEIINKVFNFEPQNIINELELSKPIYHLTTCFGHFGKDNLPWEKLDKVEIIKSLLN